MDKIRGHANYMQAQNEKTDSLHENRHEKEINVHLFSTFMNQFRVSLYESVTLKVCR